jgi:hypothetical protein
MDSTIRAAVLSGHVVMLDPRKTDVSAARARWHFYWNCYSPQGPLFDFVMSIMPTRVGARSGQSIFGSQRSD